MTMSNRSLRSARESESASARIEGRREGFPRLFFHRCRGMTVTRAISG